MRFSIQGAKHKRSYMHLHKDPNGDLYSFMAIDASLEPGISQTVCIRKSIN